MSTATTLARQEVDAAPLVPTEDAQLAQRCAKGEEDALTTLYDRHVGPIRRLARLSVDDEASAEDLVHDTFVRAIELLPGYRGDAPLSLWFRSIALNLTRNHNRKARRRRWLLAWRRRDPVDAGRIEAAEGRVEIRELLEQLHRLPAAEREAFALCRVERLSIEDAATVVGAARSTVGDRVLRAERKLRAWMNGEEESS